MKNEITLVDFKGSELVVREGQASKPIEPLSVEVVGNIDTPFRWLTKRIAALNIIACSIKIDKEAGNISLVINEKSHDYDQITGKLELHPDFVRFGINTGEQRTSHDLAELFKMNRSCFKDKETAMKLVKELRTFKAKVDKELESVKDDRANYSMKKIQAVETNIPESFILVVPVFKGQPKESIEVEINIDADKLTCSLISPQANDYIAEFKDRIIEEQIESISTFVPELVIVEV